VTAHFQRFPAVNLRLAATAVTVVLLALLNTYLFVLTDWSMLRGGAGADWTIFGEAGRRVVGGGNLYAVENDYAFRYSPILAYIFAAISWIGPWVWRLLHVLAAASLFWLDRRLAAIALLAWPFWFDVEAGNLVTFVFVLGAWALGGRRWAIGAFLVMALLVPRPLIAPATTWLLWKQPGWRWPFVALFAAHAIAAVLTGWGWTWIVALSASTAESQSVLNFGPSRLIGFWWVPIGVALAAGLTWRGRVGLAGLMASPYWLPYYFLIPLLDIRSWQTRGRGKRGRASGPSHRQGRAQTPDRHLYDTEGG
jgi:hypothetical protein